MVYVISFCVIIPPPPTSTLFPYTTLFRSYQDSVKPAAAARPAGRGAVFLPELADLVADRVGELCGKRPFAHAGRVCFRYSNHPIDARRSHSRACAGPSCSRVRRRNKGIGSVVHIQQSALGPFEED